MHLDAWDPLLLVNVDALLQVLLILVTDEQSGLVGDTNSSTAHGQLGKSKSSLGSSNPFELLIDPFSCVKFVLVTRPHRPCKEL